VSQSSLQRIIIQLSRTILNFSPNCKINLTLSASFLKRNPFQLFLFQILNKHDKIIDSERKNKERIMSWFSWLIGKPAPEQPSPAKNEEAPKQEKPAAAKAEAPQNIDKVMKEVDLHIRDSRTNDSQKTFIALKSELSKLLFELSTLQQEGKDTEKKLKEIENKKAEILNQISLARPRTEAPKSKTLIHQDRLLNKFVDILKQLQAQNPAAYDEKTINSIIKDLLEGQCQGFSLYFTQLALLKDPTDQSDRTHEYNDLMNDILRWDGDLYEAPEGFSYIKYQNGDKQGLTPDQEARLAFTNKVKELIQIIRFEQQNLIEVGQWGKNQISETNDLLKQMPSVPYNQTHLVDFRMILGDKFQVSETTQIMAGLADITHFLPMLEKNLTENNVAKLSVLIGISGHGISIMKREGKYYYFDSNNTGIEENYNPHHSALSYDSLEKIAAYIQTKYKNEASPDHPDFSPMGRTRLCFINLQSTPIDYPTAEEVSNQIDQENLSFLDSKAPFLFDESKTSLNAEEIESLLKIDPKIFQRLPSFSLFHIEKITLPDPEDSFDPLSLFYLLKAAPNTEISGKGENLAIALYYKGRQLHQKSTLPEAVTFYKKASDLGNLKANINLGKIYLYGNDDIPKDIAMARHYYELAAQKSRDKVELELGKAIDFLYFVAEEGGSDAQLRLGEIYEEGFVIVDADLDIAIEYYAQAAERNNPEALERLSILAKRNDLRKDQRSLIADILKDDSIRGESETDKAQDHLKRAAFYLTEGNLEDAYEIYNGMAEYENNPEAQFQLAKMYEQGLHVEEDLERAKDYYERAASQGHEEANARLEELMS
jgi:TPR repeat protein